MTDQPNTSTQAVSAQGCCGGAGAKGKPADAIELAKPAAAPSSIGKGSAAPNPAGSCCGGGGDTSKGAN